MTPTTPTPAARPAAVAEALRLAREALKVLRPHFTGDMVRTVFAPTEAAIDSALAQPPQAPAAVEVSRLADFANSAVDAFDEFRNTDPAKVVTAINNLRFAVLASTASEPAARLVGGEAPDEWRPISTAPQHGTILLWWKNAGACTGGFAVDDDWTPKSGAPREGWKGDGDEGIPRNQEDCTHWQVLRAPRGCKWPRFSDGFSTQEWFEQHYAATQPPRAAAGATPHRDELDRINNYIAINPMHEAADAFWQYWRENGETHKHGYYESTWGAINRAIRLAGIREHRYGEKP